MGQLIVNECILFFLKSNQHTGKDTTYPIKKCNCERNPAAKAKINGNSSGMTWSPYLLIN